MDLISAKRSRLATSLLLIGLMLGGCAGTDNAQPEFDSVSIKAKADAFREEGRTDLAELFEDGVVDGPDYESAYQVFRRCMGARGYELSPPALSPADGLRYIISFRSEGKSEAELTRDRDECSADLGEVEAMYTATAEQVMQPELRSHILNCMQQQGLRVDPEAHNYPQMVGSEGRPQEWHIGLSDCLGEARQELYPELPYLPVGF